MVSRFQYSFKGSIEKNAKRDYNIIDNRYHYHKEVHMNLSKYSDKVISEYSPMNHKEKRHHHSFIGRHVKDSHYRHQQASYQFIDKKKTDLNTTK